MQFYIQHRLAKNYFVDKSVLVSSGIAITLLLKYSRAKSQFIIIKNLLTLRFLSNSFTVSFVHILD